MISFSLILAAVISGNMISALMVWAVVQLTRSEKDPNVSPWVPYAILFTPSAWVFLYLWPIVT